MPILLRRRRLTSMASDCSGIGSRIFAVSYSKRSFDYVHSLWWQSVKL